MKASQPSALGRGLSVIGKLFVGTRKGPSGDRVRQLKKLERKIGIKFTDLGLLEQALTHRSYSHVTSQTRNQSNERMEFLGDSVLGLSVSQFLYLQFPDRSEGALSKMKSLLVSRKVLSAVARDSGLGEFLLLSGEESEMGGRDRTSILADSFEGVIGAIYLDQGFRAANKFIQRFLLGSIHEILKDEEHTNFKSLLQEYVQSKRLSHPVYRVRREEGPEHEKEFAIEVVVRSEVWGVGRGKSKKDAEQNAARAALESRQSRDAARRGRGSADGEGEAAATAERPARPSREGRTGRGERRGRERREPREAREPRDAAPQDRGEHGILASREKLRSARREEAEQRRREEREFRERRDERTRSDDHVREERSRPEEGARAEGRRRDRRGRGGRDREARAERGGPSPVEGAATAGFAASVPEPAERTEDAPVEAGFAEGMTFREPPAETGAETTPAAGGSADADAPVRGFGRRRRSRRGGRDARGEGGRPRREDAAPVREPDGMAEEGPSSAPDLAEPRERTVRGEDARVDVDVDVVGEVAPPSERFEEPVAEPERSFGRSSAFDAPADREFAPTAYERAESTAAEPASAEGTAPEDATPEDATSDDGDTETAGVARTEGGFSRRKRRHARGLRRR